MSKAFDRPRPPGGLRWRMAAGYAVLALAVTGLLTGLAVHTSAALTFAAERQRSLVAVSAAEAAFARDLSNPNADLQSAAAQLGAAGTGIHDPQWSRDGRRLLYIRDDAVWELPVSGGSPQRVAGPVDVPNAPYGYYGHLDWAAGWAWYR